MKVTRKSSFTGIVRTMDLPITPEQYSRWRDHRVPIQKVMGHLTPGQREFIMTGITDEEWNAEFSEERPKAKEPK